MGFLFSKSLNENLREQREFMSMNSRLQLERQLQMQNQMRERQMAMQVAWSRELLKYYGTFFGIASLGLTAGAIKRKRPALFLPVIPLSFILAYQYDMGHGTLLRRMKDSVQATSNKDLDNLKLQSYLGSDLEQHQLPNTNMPFGRQPTKDLFNAYDDYNEYVPVSDDFNEYIRQVEEAAQKPRSGAGANPQEASNRFPWINYPRRKRDYSMGVAGMCCKWGCTKAEISTLC